MALKLLLFQLLFFLCGGTFLSFGVLKQTRVGKQYFRIHGLGAFALCLFAFLLLGRFHISPSATFWFALFLSSLLAFSLTVGRDIRISMAAFFLGALAFLGTIVLDATDSIPPSLQTDLILNSILSSLMLGFTMAAMLLGHWYLVQPKLSIEELARTVFVMIAVTALRGVYALYMLIFLLSERSEPDLMRYFTQDPGVFVLMRTAWGLILPAILSYFIFQTVKIRSTQSATGILYVSVVAVLAGEILSLYLARAHGLSF